MSLRGAAELRRHLLRFLLWADPSKEVFTSGADERAASPARVAR